MRGKELRLRSLEGVAYNVEVLTDLGIEQGNSDQSDGPRTRFVLYTDSRLWHQLMMAKDLQLELLRWYLCLKKFDFVVCDKNDGHTLTDPNQV